MKKAFLEKTAANLQNMNDIHRSNLNILVNNKNILLESLDALNFIEFMLFDFFFYEGFDIHELIEYTEQNFSDGKEKDSAVKYMYEILESFEEEKEKNEEENN